MSVFACLLPNNAIVVEACTPSDWEHGLLPQEAMHMAHAVPKRRREFTAGRNCARRALASLGFSGVAIGVGADRQPLFPADVSGTITHTDDYCAAAVIRQGKTLCIGIDAEVAQPLDGGAAALILLPEELRMAAEFGRELHFADTLVFSIKEAFYKAYFQRAARYLDFLDARVHLVPEQKTFTIQILRDDVDGYFRNAFTGRYDYDKQRIYTAIALPI